MVKFIRLRGVFNSVGFGQISWNESGVYMLMMRIDVDDFDYCNDLICSSSIKCTSKILYNLYTTPLTPNGTFLGSQFDKNEFKTRSFQERTMRIRSARYCGALIYQNYLDTDDVNGSRLCVYLVVCVIDWLLMIHNQNSAWLPIMEKERYIWKIFKYVHR